MIQVTCAIIEHNNKILICQRSASMKLPLKWEFPGGKLEPFETKEECIIREIKEELNLEIEILSPMQAVEHHYSNFSIRLIPFVCRLVGGDLKIKEHRQAIWVNRNSLNDYDWAEADAPVMREVFSKRSA